MHVWVHSTPLRERVHACTLLVEVVGVNAATVSLSVRVPPDVRERLQEVSFHTKRSQSEIVTEALRAALGASGALPARDEMLARAESYGLKGAEAMGDEELYDALCDIGLARVVAEDVSRDTGEPGISMEDMLREFHS